MQPELLNLFVVNEPVIEIALRGAALYLLLFVLFRFLIRREALSLGIGESIVLVLIADASQNVMAGEATSLAESAILAASMFGCYLLVRMAWALRHRLQRRLRRGRGRSRRAAGMA
jgi:uncharacterized membrane protein YcaP (DUF421 family)